jgi:hypothetical protein
MSIFDQIFNDVVTPYLEPRIKRSSIKAMKGYIKGVEMARQIAITSYRIGIVAAIAVAGVTLMLVAIAGLLPLDPRAALLGLLTLGAVMAAGAAFLAHQWFREKQWLEMSKSHEMMDAVLKPWATAYSIPDPRKILQKEEAQDSYDENRKLQMSRENRHPAPTVYDDVDSHAPISTFGSMVTPDSAVATGPIDTTAELRRP